MFWLLQNLNISQMAYNLASKVAIPELQRYPNKDRPWMQTPAVYSLTEIPYESGMLVAATFVLLGRLKRTAAPPRSQ